jgi:hypothetical protein
VVLTLVARIESPIIVSIELLPVHILFEVLHGTILDAIALVT